MGTKSPEQQFPLARMRVVMAGLVVMLACVLGACGIDFGEASPETEIFKGVTIEGPLVPGEPLTLTLSYARQYPVGILVRCDLLTKEDVPTVTPLPSATLAPLAERRTPEPTLPHIPRIRPTPTTKLFEILGTDLEPYDEGGPVGEATPVLGTIERRFLAPDPGEYVVWCYTPADLNNAIFEDLTIPE